MITSADDWSGRMRYQIPLGSGRHAILYLPEDLTEAEARRLCPVVQALSTGQTERSPFREPAAAAPA